MRDVIAYLNSVLKHGDKVVVGVSGGPDSVFLLDMLVKSDIDNNNIIVGHVNHNVREESIKEEEFVRDICFNYGVVFESIMLPKEYSGNFEKWARDRRYEFFEQLIDKYSAEYLMTAHHGDDLMETILMKIVRGSSVKGYSGILKKEIRNNYTIIRPLLDITKDDISDYLDKNGIKYVIDRSNYSLDYTRNRFRHNILKYLKNEDKNVHLKFRKFSDKIISVSNFFDRYVENIIDEVIVDKKIIIDKFKGYERVVQEEIVYKFLFNYYENDICLINDKHINMIIDMINNDRPNMSINLPNFKIVKEYNYLYISNLECSDYKEEILNDRVLWNDRVIELVDNSHLSNNNVIYLNSDDIKLPLKVRTKIDGDRIRIKNMQQYKKVKDIFINEKISRSERDRWPIVVDSDNEIVWIPGLKKSYLDSQKSEKYDIIVEYH